MRPKGDGCLESGVAELGRVDIVLPNAGIAQLGGPEPDAHRTWPEVIWVDLTGFWNTVHVAAPRMIEQGDGEGIALVSSIQGLTGRGGDGSGPPRASRRPSTVSSD